MYDIVSKRFWLFLVSGILILAGIISMATPFGRLKLSTEFSSGTQLRVSFTQTVSQSELRQELASLGYTDVIIRNEILVSGVQGDYIIRTRVLSETEQEELIAGLSNAFGTVDMKGFQNVSPEIATETIRFTIIAVVVAALGILLYMMWAFRQMPHPFRYGTCAIVALIHDVIVSVGIFSIIGGFLGWEIDLMFITGVLTIIGFSCDNSVVIFDRIRENLRMGISHDFELIVNDSIIGTIGRCLNTSLTVVLVTLALLVFVGVSIQNLVVVMLIGAITGTFDSICVAPNLLVVWQNHEWGRFIGRKTKAIA
jgi:preprotein translocase subunit SecF